MKKVRFNCHGHYAPAYTCSFPGDNSGLYVPEDVADRLHDALGMLVGSLPANRDWLDPDVEMFAKHALSEARGENAKQETP